jgi:hypothetical protein
MIDVPDSKVETVASRILSPMLLNELQKRSRRLAQNDAQIVALQVAVGFATKAMNRTKYSW